MISSILCAARTTRSLSAPSTIEPVGSMDVRLLLDCGCSGGKGLNHRSTECAATNPNRSKRHSSYGPPAEGPADGVRGPRPEAECKRRLEASAAQALLAKFDAGERGCRLKIRDDDFGPTHAPPPAASFSVFLLAPTMLPGGFELVEFRSSMAISGEIRRGSGSTPGQTFPSMNGRNYFTSASTNPAVREARSS